MSDYTGDYREEVARGVALLDELKPGWRELIDTDDLSMQMGTRCVLGQVFGNDDDDSWYGENGYFRGLKLLGLSDDGAYNRNTSAEHGFMINDDDWRYDRWDILQSAWAEVL